MTKLATKASKPRIRAKGPAVAVCGRPDNCDAAFRIVLLRLVSSRSKLFMGCSGFEPFVKGFILS